VSHDQPAATALMDEPFSSLPSGVSGSVEAQIRDLQQQLDALRNQHRTFLETLVRDLDDLTSRIRNRLR
jgi:hypothetical protein